MLVIGCGYIGRRVARRYRDRGERVSGLVRTAQSAALLEQNGISSLRRDLAVDNLDDLRCGGERLFHFAPPPAEGVEDSHTQRLVAAFERAGHPQRVVYIGTTGVYGDCEGAWVDETWPARPAVDRARRRWDAEQTLCRWSNASGSDLVILRVAGIYGPGRLPLERIRQGLPVVRSRDAPFTNRIHADDLVEVCVAAMDRGQAGAVYNVCDGNPSTMTDYFFRLADGAGLPRPPTISLEQAQDQLSPGMMSYMRESRRLINRKIVEELGVELQFPTLEAGLRDCLS